MHFVIVSYTFPPSKEIGGRRWAKFSQQLNNKGFNISVVCVGDKKKWQWYKNEFPGIKFYLHSKRYPDWLSGLTKNLLEKLLYFITIRLISPFTKYNLFDKGVAWRKPLLNTLEEIHSKNPINVLIVTGGPFSLLGYGADFKTKYPHIFYVCDIRDPWTWGNLYGMSSLTLRKKQFQEVSELKAIQKCDMFCYPTEHMGKFLKEKYGSFLGKFHLLPHAFDPCKFPDINNGEVRNGFIYGGTLYSGIEEYIKTLGKILEKNPNSSFEWQIYTSTHYPLIDSKYGNGKVNLYPLIAEDKLFEKIQKSAAYLAFFPVSDKDLISTKFFEIIHTKTPIVYIGEEGDVGRFIRENKLGVHILPHMMEQELPKYLNGNIPFEPGYFDISKFSISKVTDVFLNTIQNYFNNKDI